MSSICRCNMYQAIANALLEETKSNMKKAAKECLEDAKQVVPVDTGQLRESGKIVAKDDSTIEVIFDAEHAIYVHEMPSQSGYKFLEKNVNKNMTKYQSIIQKGY